MLDFSNTEIAFQYKSTKDLKKAYWLFKIIGYNWLIKVGPSLLNVALKLHLPVLGIIKNTVFKQFCGGETINECETVINTLGKYNVKTILDYSVEGKENEREFDKNVNQVLATIDKAKDNPNIPFSVFKPTGFARFSLLEKINAHKKLSVEEEKEFERVRARIDKMCQHAYQLNVPVFIDAEESWIQDVIDDLALEMMKKYNKEKAIVYNTAQMYRVDRLAYLKGLLAEAEKEDFYIGMKLVRGAYMEKERERAEKYGYESPIQPNKEATDRDFDLALKFCVQHFNRFAICCGTHNENSSLLLTQLMSQNNIEKNNPKIYFAQLYGMSDHISFNLAKAGYNVAKYVPYGPVKDVIPYLIRRAQENTSVAGQQSRELFLIKKELLRRKTVK
jgi:proline dehydrogenase